MPRALFAVLCLCCLATGKVTGPNKKHGGSQDEDPTLRLARAVAAAVVQELSRQQPQALPPPAPMLPMLPPQPMAPWPGYPGPMMMISGGGPMLQPMMGYDESNGSLVAIKVYQKKLRLLFLAVFEFQPGSPAKRSHSDYRIPWACSWWRHTWAWFVAVWTFNFLFVRIANEFPGFVSSCWPWIRQKKDVSVWSRLPVCCCKRRRLAAPDTIRKEKSPKGELRRMVGWQWEREGREGRHSAERRPPPGHE